MGRAKPGIRLTDESAEFVRSLHPHLKLKIKAAFRALMEDPLSGKALKDELEGLRSFRVGRIRVIYRAAGKEIVEVIAVGPRKTIYEETMKLLLKEK